MEKELENKKIKDQEEEKSEKGTETEVEEGTDTKEPEATPTQDNAQPAQSSVEVKGEVSKGVEADTDTAEDSLEATVEDKEANEDSIEDGTEKKPEVEEKSNTEEKMLTQSQVNELVGKARIEGRQSALKELYERYGVSTDAELNDIFGRGQGYDLLNDDYNNLNGRYSDLSAENALLKSKILDSRWSDVKAILKAKGMEVTLDNIASELATHPEWSESSLEKGVEVSKEVTPEKCEETLAKARLENPVGESKEKAGTIRKLGSNIPDSKDNLEESDIARLFGMQ